MRIAWEFGSGREPPPQREFDIIPLSGYLWKRKRNQQLGTPAWNKRWFTVEGDSLYWYKSRSSEQASGKIPLLSIARVAKGKKEENGVLSFFIKAKSRSFLLRAQTPGEVNKWVRGLHLQLDLRRGGTAQGPPCRRNYRVRKEAKNNYDVLLDKVSRTIAELDKMMLEAETRELKESVENCPTTSTSESSVKEPANSEQGDSIGGALDSEKDQRKDVAMRQVPRSSTFGTPVAIHVEPKRQKSRNVSCSRKVTQKGEPLFYRCEGGSRQQRPETTAERSPTSPEIEDLSDNDSILYDGAWGGRQAKATQKKPHCEPIHGPAPRKGDRSHKSPNQGGSTGNGSFVRRESRARPRSEAADLCLDQGPEEFRSWHGACVAVEDPRLQYAFEREARRRANGAARPKGRGVSDAPIEDQRSMRGNSWNVHEARPRVRRWTSPEESEPSSMSPACESLQHPGAEKRYQKTSGDPHARFQTFDADSEHG